MCAKIINKNSKDGFKMKKHNVAILGFGVVGGGVGDLLTNNCKEISSYTDCDVRISHILDLRDFPGSPFERLVTHNYDDILNDKDVDTVIEVMGGSHPAYEYTVAALKAGKNVISSNKEVVANFGDEFLKIAKEYNVSYKFEASVGGGIPVISPLINCVRQNKITEIRGILNGTTNYILTMMFTYGASFDSALKDAQDKGYAERNPDADILGIDASRKITILTALMTDTLYNVADVHTEGITKIRSQDIKAAEGIAHSIKLLGRCIVNDGKPYVMVAPFLIPKDAPLGSVSGVFNAVEVIGEPLGSAMFYGPGAGAGATASAVVGDLIQILTSKEAKAPTFARGDFKPSDSFSSFVCRNYIAIPTSDKSKVESKFGNVTFIESEECAFVTEPISENELDQIISDCGISILSRIRFL